MTKTTRRGFIVGSAAACAAPAAAASAMAVAPRHTVAQAYWELQRAIHRDPKNQSLYDVQTVMRGAMANPDA